MGDDEAGDVETGVAKVAVGSAAICSSQAWRESVGNQGWAPLYDGAVGRVLAPVEERTRQPGAPRLPPHQVQLIGAVAAARGSGVAGASLCAARGHGADGIRQAVSGVAHIAVQRKVHYSASRCGAVGACANGHRGRAGVAAELGGERRRGSSVATVCLREAAKGDVAGRQGARRGGRRGWDKGVEGRRRGAATELQVGGGRNGCGAALPTQRGFG